MTLVSRDVQPPDWFKGSKPEWLTYNALLNLGYIEGVDFIFQQPFGGGREVGGGAVVDFYFPFENMAININSTYFHYAKVRNRLQDIMVETQLATQWGVSMVYIDEEHLYQNAAFYVSQALKGKDYSRMSIGVF